ncbi:hypothetical protein [Paenibacillus sp. sgz500958]|uniref:hypothetical protein n=1 Tax=Paenibacillus sp. sgz500958 TaxID=3242475 RepID=UPI0036D426EA
MQHDERVDRNIFAGDGFVPESADQAVNGEAPDTETQGSNLWECCAGSPEEWLKDWEGRQETHDMFHNSYE